MSAYLIHRAIMTNKTWATNEWMTYSRLVWIWICSYLLANSFPDSDSASDWLTKCASLIIRKWHYLYMTDSESVKLTDWLTDWFLLLDSEHATDFRCQSICDRTGVTTRVAHRMTQNLQVTDWLPHYMTTCDWLISSLTTWQAEPH